MRAIPIGQKQKIFVEVIIVNSQKFENSKKGVCKMQNLKSVSNNNHETKDANINQIVLRDKIQQRENINDSCVEDYVEELSNGTVFPPLVVYDDGEGLLLADGFHRYEAHRKSGAETVTVTIYKGSERDAILHAVGANSDHGLRRTNADKRKAVETLLKDEEWREWSDGSIAERCRVSRPFVGKIRDELTSNGYESGTIRKGADGRETDVSNIGAKSNEGQAEEPSTEEEIESQQSDTDPQIDSEEDHPKASEQDTSVDVPVAEAEDNMDEDSETPGAESNNNSDVKDSSEPDDSTSDEFEAEEPSQDENLVEQEPQEENGSEQTGDDESSSKGETEVDIDVGISTEPESVDSEINSIEPPDTDDVQALKTEIVELKKNIIIKDRRIIELEKEVSKLKENVKYYEKEAADSFKGNTGKMTDITEQQNYYN